MVKAFVKENTQAFFYAGNGNELMPYNLKIEVGVRSIDIGSKPLVYRYFKVGIGM
jgi:hypothetical protein